MAEHIDWCEIVGWGIDQIEDLRVTGYSYIRQGKYEIALSFFKALVVLDRGYVYDKQILGALYLQLNKPEKALCVLDEALQLEPFHASTQLNKAKALLGVGHKAEGLKMAKALRRHRDIQVANAAEALVLAYGYK